MDRGRLEERVDVKLVKEGRRNVLFQSDVRRPELTRQKNVYGDF